MQIEYAPKSVLRNFVYSTIAAASLLMAQPAYAQQKSIEIRVGNYRTTVAKTSDGRSVTGSGEVGRGSSYRAVTPEINGIRNEIAERIRIQNQKPRPQPFIAIRKR